MVKLADGGTRVWARAQRRTETALAFKLVGLGNILDSSIRNYCSYIQNQ